MALHAGDTSEVHRPQSVHTEQMLQKNNSVGSHPEAIRPHIQLLVSSLTLYG